MRGLGNGSGRLAGSTVDCEVLDAPDATESWRSCLALPTEWPILTVRTILVVSSDIRVMSVV